MSTLTTRVIPFVVFSVLSLPNVLHLHVGYFRNLPQDLPPESMAPVKSPCNDLLSTDLPEGSANGKGREGTAGKAGKAAYSSSSIAFPSHGTVTGFSMDSISPYIQSNYFSVKSQPHSTIVDCSFSKLKQIFNETQVIFHSLF